MLEIHDHNLIMDLLLAGMLDGVIRIGNEFKCLRETLAKKETEKKDS
jgi:hypothetical protein